MSQENKYSLEEHLFTSLQNHSHPISEQQEHPQHQEAQEIPSHASNANDVSPNLDHHQLHSRMLLPAHLFGSHSSSSGITSSSPAHQSMTTTSHHLQYPSFLGDTEVHQSLVQDSSHVPPEIPSHAGHDLSPSHHHLLLQQQQHQTHHHQHTQPQGRMTSSSSTTPNNLSLPHSMSSSLVNNHSPTSSSSVFSPSPSEERKFFHPPHLVAQTIAQLHQQQQSHHHLMEQQMSQHQNQSLRGRSCSSSSTSSVNNCNVKEVSGDNINNNGINNNNCRIAVVNSDNSSNLPHLTIVEQPTNRIRYRYKSEKGSHGGLTGENNTQAKKTYPTVRLDNYNCVSDRVMIRGSLVTHEDGNNSNSSTPRAHVHKLMGRNCTEDGVCIVAVGQNNCAVFQNLGILFVGKKEVPDILYKRKIQRLQSQLERIREVERIVTSNPRISLISEVDKDRLRNEAEREAKDLNLNCVRICFEAFDFSTGSQSSQAICPPVFSRPIANQKSPDSGELRIVRMDKQSGSVVGNEEVFILCEKVNKKEIKVRFFEMDSDGNQVWESFGSFSESDVHHQVAIVFRTPAYLDENISHAVTTFLQLYRPKDGEYSEAKPFVFLPKGVSGHSGSINGSSGFMDTSSSFLPRTSSDASFNRVDRRKRFSSVSTNNNLSSNSSTNFIHHNHRPHSSSNVENNDNNNDSDDKEDSFISFD